jgi:membrane protein
VDAVAVLKVLHGSARLTGTTLVSGAQIRAHTRIGYDEMSLLLDRMVAAGWVGRVQQDARAQVLWGWNAREGMDNWVLLVDPAQIRLADVYRLFVFGGFETGAATGIVRPGAAAGAAPLVSPLSLDTETLARQVELAVEGGLEQTLAEHFG